MKAFALVLALTSLNAFAVTYPDKLVIGYENEGKVDSSLKSCTALVKEITSWEGDLFDQGVVQVCTARQSHAAAYEKLQANYKFFVKTIGEDNRLNQLAALAALKRTVKTCIEFRTNLTTGGHNIGIDIIPNDIAAACLEMGAKLLSEQADKYAM